MNKKGPGAMYNILAFIFAGHRQALSIHDDLKARKKYETHKVIASSVVEVDDKKVERASYRRLLTSCKHTPTPKWSEEKNVGKNSVVKIFHAMAAR